MLPLKEQPSRNSLLRSLPEPDWQLIRPYLTPVELDARTVVGEPSVPIEHVHFVESGLVSVIAVANDQQVEVATIGREGMTGVPIVHGSLETPHLLVVQIAGVAQSLRAEDLSRAMEESAALRRLLLLYAHTLQIQMAHTAFVNARYTIEQRLARWLLVCQDKVGDELTLTHDFLATMLGTRRAGVTDAIHMLEGEHLIRATRSHLEVRDRAGLITRAAGSYGLPEAEYRKTMGPILHDRGEARSLAGKRILLVEDEYELAMSMGEALSDLGAQIVGPVASLHDALSLLDATRVLDGAIVDIRLGGEMTFTLADALRDRNVPFMFVSGHQRELLPERLLAVDFHQRPVEAESVALSFARATRVGN